MKAVPVALAVIFFIISALYLLGILQIATSHPGRHLSHAILFAVLGVLSLVWMRFQSAPVRGR